MLTSASPDPWFYDGNIVGEYSATSGVPGSGSADQFTKGYGSIPEGSYTLYPSEISKAGLFRSFTGDWGTYRAPLHIDGIVVHDRNGFFLHGGKTPGSAGCIDVGSNDVKLFNSIMNHNGAISVTVKY